MKILIESNPGQKPLLGYKRVIERGLDGARDTEVDEHTLTRAPGTKWTFSVSPSAKLGGYLNTGLLFEVENPYKDSDKPYKSKEWEAILKDADKITKQTELEYKHGRNPGFYTNQIQLDASNRSYKDRLDEIPYFQTSTASINLNDGVTVLDMSIPREEVLYYNMKAADSIANSFAELSSRTKFFISIEDETAKAKQSKKRKENIALGRLETIYDINDGTVINFCKLVGGTPSTRRELTETQAYNELDAFIKKNETQATQFNNVHKMYTKDIVKFNVKVKLWNFLDARMISKIANSFQWEPPRDEDGVQRATVKWDRESDILEYLEDPRFQAEQELLEKQYKARLRI
jgi:hypothetical protein